MVKTSRPTTSATQAGIWSQPAAVQQWLVHQGINTSPPLSITRVGIGQSNITTLIVDGDGAQWVMREPPAGASAHNLPREAGILGALSTSGIPVPKVVGLGESPWGTPFLVMERVAGSALETEEDALGLTSGQRRQLGISVATTLGRLHTLDPGKLGLQVSNSPYLLRQIRRITASWEQLRTTSRHDAQWQAVRTLLQKRLPHSPPAVIMHGDYRLSNLLVDHGRITAVLDWELCTVGDPLADLAWLLDDWRPTDEPAIVMPSPTRAGGFPDRDEIVSVYCETTGRRVDDLDYYRAFSQWRAASLLEGVRARRLSGAMGSHAAIEPVELEASIGVLLDNAGIHLRRKR